MRQDSKMDDSSGDAEENARIVAGSLPFSRMSHYRVAMPKTVAPPEGYPLVVALHGYGESGPRLQARLLPLVRTGAALLCPDGPFPVEMRTETPPRIGFAWYQYTGDAAQFAIALSEGGAFLDRLIDVVLESLPVDRRKIVLLGYSQGGYLAGAHALGSPDRFAGLVAIATRIKTELFSAEHLARVRFPVLAIHGAKDPQTAIERQRESIAQLRSNGIDARLHEHPGGHGLRRESVSEIRDFLTTLGIDSPADSSPTSGSVE